MIAIAELPLSVRFYRSHLRQVAYQDIWQIVKQLCHLVPADDKHEDLRRLLMLELTASVKEYDALTDAPTAGRDPNPNGLEIVQSLLDHELPPSSDEPIE